jgi:hypothetical protein
MTAITPISLALAFVPLIGAALFFWYEKKLAGLSFLIAFIVLLAGVSEKRVVLTGAMLGLTLERDAEGGRTSK